ncbi:MAG: hypothetical protein PHU46_03595 [Rhodocyclaceae bacterium]|nr:hypothetical protein [Rhodocyclaceae bacterium]
MADKDRRKQRERRERDDARWSGWPEERRLRPDRRSPDVAECTLDDFNKAMQEFSSELFERSTWKR